MQLVLGRSTRIATTPKTALSTIPKLHYHPKNAGDFASTRYMKTTTKKETNKKTNKQARLIKVQFLCNNTLAQTTHSMTHSMNAPKHQCFYDMSDPAWEDETFVTWVVRTGWQRTLANCDNEPTKCLIYQCRAIGNFGNFLDIIAKHNSAVQVLIDTLSTSPYTWIVDRMATFLKGIHKLNPLVFTGNDCSRMASACSRLQGDRKSHARIIKRIENIIMKVEHPKNKSFGTELHSIFETA